MDANTRQEVTAIEVTLRFLFYKSECVASELAQARTLLAKWKALTGWQEATANPILVDDNEMLK